MGDYRGYIILTLILYLTLVTFRNALRYAPVTFRNKKQDTLSDALPFLLVVFFIQKFRNWTLLVPFHRATMLHLEFILVGGSAERVEER